MESIRTFEEILKDIEQCKSINKLFELWKEAHSIEYDYEKKYIKAVPDEKRKVDKKSETSPIYPIIEQSSFIKDGYVDETKYKQCDKKVLFILKEANILDNRGNEKPCEREQVEWYNQVIRDIEDDTSVHLIEKLGRMAYYLQNDMNEDALTVDKSHWGEALKAAAFMNINKRGGSGAIDELYEPFFDKYTTKEYKVFIYKQIELIKPNIIVVLGDTAMGRELIAYFLNPEHKKKIMYMRHPSSRYHVGVSAYMNDFIKECKELK